MIVWKRKRSHFEAASGRIAADPRSAGATGNRPPLALCLLASVVLLVAGASGAEAAEYEVPKNRSVLQILPSAMVKGQHYSIREKVVSYGYLHHYTVDSDFGTFTLT